jgi:glycosyltransferase involved in cell wall biosynthesis
MIPEKRAPLGVAGVVAAARQLPDLQAIFFGDGPERETVLAEIERHGAETVISVPGFVSSEEIDAALRRALCMLLPSRREGYGLIVIEAATRGTPSIVIAGEDNAATELIEDGVNGFVVPSADAGAAREHSTVVRRERGAAVSGALLAGRVEELRRWPSKRSLRDRERAHP